MSHMTIRSPNPKGTALVKDEKSVRLKVTVTQTDAKNIDRVASDSGATRGDVVRNACRLYVAAHFAKFVAEPNAGVPE